MIVLLVAWPAYNLGLALFASWRPRRAPRGPVPTLQFWIVIPALNEERVVAATVRAALLLHTPFTPVRVLVVDDGSDDGTLRVLEALERPRLHVLRRQPPDARKGKGEALNEAYRYIRDRAVQSGTADSCVVGVIDGDGRGAPGMLHEIAGYFADPGVGAVQCRVRIHNRERLFGFLQDLEFGCVADGAQGVRDTIGSVGLGGNGQFVRLRCLLRLGDAPWSSCLVEDLELGLRLHVAGERIRYAKDATITQQGVVDLRSIVRQRARWGQGNLQCLRFVSRLLGASTVSGIALLEFLYYLLTPWLMAPMSLAVLGLAGLLGYGAVTGQSLGGIVAVGSSAPLAGVLVLAALLLPGLMWGLVHWLRHRDEPLWRALLVGLLYPCFLLVGVAASWVALGRHLSGRRSWAKTERLPDAVADPAPAAAG
ncbi:glycosyltransferase [Solihabitans fulvus]|nr:glycosyltransferase [Solihabitans fulvus]